MSRSGLVALAVLLWPASICAQPKPVASPSPVSFAEIDSSISVSLTPANPRKFALVVASPGLLYLEPNRGFPVTVKYSRPGGESLAGDGTRTRLRKPGIVQAEVLLSGRQAKTGTLRFGFLRDSDTLEPNDTPDRAATVGLNRWEEVSLPWSGDRDYVRVETAQRGHLFFDALNLPQGVRVAGYLVGRDGREDPAPVTNKLGILLSAGTHTFRLRNGSKTFSPQAFQVRFRLERGLDDFTLEGDTPKRMEPGRTYFMTIMRKGLLCGFEIEVPRPSRLYMNTGLRSAPTFSQQLRDRLGFLKQPVRVLRDGKQLDLAEVASPKYTSFLTLRQPGTYRVYFRPKHVLPGVWPVYLTLEDLAGHLPSTALPMQLNTPYRIRPTEHEWRTIEIPAPGSLTVQATTLKVLHPEVGAAPIGYIDLLAADGKTLVKRMVQPAIHSRPFEPSRWPDRAIRLTKPGRYYLWYWYPNGATFRIEANFTPDGDPAKPRATNGFTTIHAGLGLNDLMEAEARATAAAGGGGFLHDATGDQLAAKLRDAVEAAEKILEPPPPPQPKPKPAAPTADPKEPPAKPVKGTVEEIDPPPSAWILVGLIVVIATALGGVAFARRKPNEEATSQPGGNGPNPSP